MSPWRRLKKHLQPNSHGQWAWSRSRPSGQVGLCLSIASSSLPPQRVPRWPFHSFSPSFWLSPVLVLPLVLQTARAGLPHPVNLPSFSSNMVPTTSNLRLILFAFFLLIFDFCCAYPSPYSHTWTVYQRQEETTMSTPVNVTTTQQITT